MATLALNKFDPRYTMQLGQAPLTGNQTAAMHSTSASGFTVSGTALDRKDGAQIEILQADDYYGHIHVHRYLPDFDLSGLTLQFDVQYTNLEGLESWKFAWVDWPYLVVAKTDGTFSTLRLWDYAMLQGGTFPVASGTLTFQTSAGEDWAQGDRITVFFLTQYWDLNPNLEVRYGFIALGVTRATAASCFFDGTWAAGDVIDCLVTKDDLNTFTASYTVLAGDGYDEIANAVAAAVNGHGSNDSHGVTATSDGVSGISWQAKAIGTPGNSCKYKFTTNSIAGGVRDGASPPNSILGTTINFSGGVGPKNHTVTVDSGTADTYTYAEQVGDTNTAVANGVIAAINNAGSPATGDPDVLASGDADPAHSNEVILTRRLDTGATFTVSSNCTGLNQGVVFTMRHLKTSGRAAAIMGDLIIATNWAVPNYGTVLIASVSGAVLTLKAGRYGTVNRSGTSVTWVSGDRFAGLANGDPCQIGGVLYTVSSVASPTALTLTSGAGSDTGAAYLSTRGGSDGNMHTVYAVAANSHANTSPASVKLSGANSDLAVWRITLDFSTLGLTSVRKAWMTFSPRLADSAAFAKIEWSAVFTNWTVSDSSPPLGNRPLKVAGPGSVLVDSEKPWCAYTGGGWSKASSNISYHGYHHTTATTGNLVTVEYHCQYAHDLYLGNWLTQDSGILSVRLDGDSATDLDLYVPARTGEGVGLPYFAARRKVRTAVAAGAHSLVLELKTTKNPASTGFNWIFDFVQAVVESDIQDPAETKTDVGFSLDLDTYHSVALPPARVIYGIDRSGLHGPINYFLGVLYAFARIRVGATFPSFTVTVGGTWVEGETATLTFGGVAASKVVVAGDTTSTIAAHFAYYINAVFTAIWASVSSNVVTITVRSPSDVVAWEMAETSASGTLTSSTGGSSGTLGPGTAGIYEIDPAASPVLDRAARDWNADFYAQVAAKSWTATTALSVEFTNPPDYADASPPGQIWSSRYLDNSEAEFEIVPGFNAIHCAFTADVLVYQKKVALELAAAQNTAGLTPDLQWGEFLWWYNQGTYAEGMALYDADTAAAAQTALGRPLYQFHTENDDPSVNAYADANFLRNRLRDHIAALRAHVVATYPTAKFQLLWAYNVNRPATEPDPQRLNRYINLPAEFEQKAGSGLDEFRMEALNFGAFDHNLDRARRAFQYPYGTLAWAKADVSYNLPVMTPHGPWAREYLLARRESIARMVFWAKDHFDLRSEQLPLPVEEGRTL